MTYAQKLKDPRWQKKRLLILNRDKFTCTNCGSEDKTLHIHHLVYENGGNPWDSPDDNLLTLCEDCHEEFETFYKEIAPLIIRKLRLSLKDTFIHGCAKTVVSRFENWNDLIYMLWEMNEEEAIEGLREKLYKMADEYAEREKSKSPVETGPSK